MEGDHEEISSRSIVSQRRSESFLNHRSSALTEKELIKSPQPRINLCCIESKTGNRKRMRLETRTRYFTNF
ncbi:hypothetical protein YC2023_041221 [Brassica napus]